MQKSNIKSGKKYHDVRISGKIVDYIVDNDHIINLLILHECISQVILQRFILNIIQN